MIFIILAEVFNHKDFAMDINYKCKNSQFSDTLAGFFGKNINLAHIKLVSLFITALCKARTVCFSKLATCFDSKAKSDSCLRRIQLSWLTPKRFTLGNGKTSFPIALA